jgi:hypothetical protein
MSKQNKTQTHWAWTHGGFPEWGGTAKSSNIGYYQWENQLMVWGTVFPTSMLRAIQQSHEPIFRCSSSKPLATVPCEISPKAFHSVTVRCQKQLNQMIPELREVSVSES